ncbi:MAG: response regulator [Elusimicrobia bacterium]|nr:response regulator [Elusimicrobiota bacterium]
METPLPGGAAGQPGYKANILLVDDQPEALLALEAILEDLGQNLVKARSGQEALWRLLHEDYAAILMDVQMPGMDGLETAALIRDRDKSRHIPIIFMTAAYRNEASIFRGYAVGAVDYIVKPIVPEILRSKISVFVDLARKNEMIRRQAQLLRDAELREHKKQIEDALAFSHAVSHDLRAPPAPYRKLRPNTRPILREAD